MIPERKFCAVVVAGGKGTRADSELPKQFHSIAGKPMLMHTLTAFHEHDYRTRIVLVLPEEYRSFWEELCSRHQFVIPHAVVNGGNTRFHSVRNGFREVSEEETVAIHDGARPFVTGRLIERCFNMAFERGIGVIPVVDEVNSVRVLTETGNKLFDRSRLKIVQTPQAFPANVLKRAYETEYNTAFTDDASVAEHYGLPIQLIEGEETNIKITTPLDLMVAEQYLVSLSKR